MSTGTTVLQVVLDESPQVVQGQRFDEILINASSQGVLLHLRGRYPRYGEYVRRCQRVFVFKGTDVFRGVYAIHYGH